MTQALNRLYRLSSSIYTTPESEIAIDPREIPPYWPRAFGMDIRWNGTTALWSALDPQSGILYVYSEPSQSNAEPAVQVQGILSRGGWIPGVIDPMANGRSQDDGWRLLETYQKLGLKLQSADSSEESGISEVWQRMSSGRLKVFRMLANFFEEYRLYRRNEQGQVVKENDQLMNCLRHLYVSGQRLMRTEPTPKLEQRYMSPCGPHGWMA